jgi:hypothetical protein
MAPPRRSLRTSESAAGVLPPTSLAAASAGPALLPRPRPEIVAPGCSESSSSESILPNSDSVSGVPSSAGAMALLSRLPGPLARAAGPSRRGTTRERQLAGPAGVITRQESYRKCYITSFNLLLQKRTSEQFHGKEGFSSLYSVASLFPFLDSIASDLF